MSVTTTPEGPGRCAQDHGRRPAAPDRRRAARPQDAVEVDSGRVQEAGPAGPAQEPGHVRRRGRRRADHLHGDHQAVGLQLDDRRLAVADRGLRQPGRGRGRGPRQGAGRDAAPDQAGDRGPPADRLAARARRRSAWRNCARHPAHARRPRGGRGRRDHPRRRRRRRGRRLGGRVGDHRRVRAGHPRVRRRPVRGHRRHQGAVRPDRGEDHLQAGRDLHRPDDRPGRRRAAAEDAERDRAEHPARGADDHLHARRGHAAADGVLLRGTADAWSSWSRCWSR